VSKQCPLLLLCSIAFIGALVSARGNEAAPFVEWLTMLQQIERHYAAPSAAGPPAASELCLDLEALRSNIEEWTSTHPQFSTAPLPPVQDCGAGRPPDVALHALRAWIYEAIRRNPSGPFLLGRIEVNVTAEMPPAPAGELLSAQQISRFGTVTAREVLAQTPGVTISTVGARNEGVIYIRGFDMRQTPVYLDGIPVSVPYDGYLDLSRLMIYDIAEAQVAKGYSSVAYGPNTLGGAVNLITRKPSKRLESDIKVNYGSGEAFGGFVGLGARLARFYFDAGAAGVGRSFFPLSANFSPSAVQPSGHRLNSSQRDAGGKLKIGFTPRQGYEYAFGYSRQESRKDQPPYAGSDPNVRIRYWKWPLWKNESFYHAGETLLGGAYLRARLYLDRFASRLDSFDDATYTSQRRSSSFISLQNDQSYGGSLEAGGMLAARHVLKTALLFKDDTHREGNLGEPRRSFRAQTASFGLEDTIKLTAGFWLAAGVGADYFDVRSAQNYQNGVISPFPVSGLWSIKPQLALTKRIAESTTSFVSLSRKSRLPTLKDRYSYRMGRSIPNPWLKPETADHLEVGIDHSFTSRNRLAAAGFYSRVRNLMQEFYLAPNVSQIQNLGRASHHGVEFSFRSSSIPRLFIELQYTFLNRRNISRPAIPLVQTPRHRGRLAASMRVGRGILLASETQLEDGRWVLNEGGRYVRTGGFLRSDLSASVALKQGASLQAGIQNLTDRNYFLDEGYPEPGRSFFVGLSWRF